jgi:hypothetical protein
MKEEVEPKHDPHWYLKDLEEPRTLVESYILSETRRRKAMRYNYEKYKNTNRNYYRKLVK